MVGSHSAESTRRRSLATGVSLTSDGASPPEAEASWVGASRATGQWACVRSSESEASEVYRQARPET